MFGGIRRVISESEELGPPNEAEPWVRTTQQQQQQQTPRHDSDAMSAQQSPGDEAAVDAALIEMDDDGLAAAPMQVDNNNNNNIHAPLMLVHSSNHSDTSSSSLSDASGTADDTPLLGGDLLSINNNNIINTPHQDYQQELQQPGGGMQVSNEKKLKSGLKKSPTKISSLQPVPSSDRAMNEIDTSSDAGSGSQAKASQTSRDWGWFEDVHQSMEGFGGFIGSSSSHDKKAGRKNNKGVSSATGDAASATHRQDNDAAAMAVTAPTYVLEESLSSQKLWKDTAGNRPPQPLEERAFFEKMWAQNFALSQVNYSMPVEVLTASSPISLNPFADGLGFEGGTTAGAELASYNIPVATVSHHQAPPNKEAALVSRMTEESSAGTLVNQRVRGTGSDGDLTVLLRGPNAFGTTVSKSFAKPSNGGPISGVDTVNISIASYRVVESKKYGKYAQFLVIYREGSIRDTIGVWKRYRDFEELAHKVTQAHEGCASVIANISPMQSTAASRSSSSSSADDQETEHLPNAVTSWCLLKKRKRWYRCLDAGYLSLKVFLLERFLHDILFESSSPQLLRDFVLGPPHSRHNSEDST